LERVVRASVKGKSNSKSFNAEGAAEKHAEDAEKSKSFERNGRNV